MTYHITRINGQSGYSELKEANLLNKQESPEKITLRGFAKAGSFYEALEEAFLSAKKELAGELLGSAKKNPGCILDKEYGFDWETLGGKGISACPELVEDIRTFLEFYDRDLLLLADSLSLSRFERVRRNAALQKRFLCIRTFAL
jgi:hypothetical protein